jgi:hypothetical protein
MADSVARKASKARDRAMGENYNRGASSKTENLVMDLTRGKKSKADKILGRFPDAAESRAANVMQQRRRTDTMKTASRATAIAKRTEKKAIEAKVRAGVSGSSPRKAAPKPTATKKPAPKKK